MKRQLFYKVATQCGSLQTRSMFGGTGIFQNNVMYALIREQSIYLRSHPLVEPKLAELACEKFKHIKKSSVATVNYYDITELVEEQSDLAVELVKLAIEGAKQDDEAKRCKSKRRLRDLPNMQLTTERMMKKAGIENVDTFLEKGASYAFARICEIYGRDIDMRLLWKLAGAVDGIHWELIQEPKRQQLLQECRHFGFVALQ
ncbi:TfoX/Sxy family DNA transformation protein [Vibrio porteresiae]|uniref:TfoX/Sxy family DNA transformation protein n=1 Tax=Vibrio porteresiae DSM 19223 TaxID=1123496 RepID=A0ABZ0QBZ4_9VIBR|nr:TfoX/Sxy family DNA transformation protein [Vibrio porteresiae]WPC73085.1 TfoX/Sxy family DNA transformation protein [Vibrio porteresiae DSM 19223]